MNQENTNTLYERYPRLYQGRTLSLQESQMSWGFACGDGWFALIDRLSSQIEAECERMRKEEGWREDQLPIAIQVKEKTGSLRFHLRAQSGAWFIKNETLYALVEAARVASEHTCDSCGGPRIRRAENEIETLCDKCSQDMDKSAQ